MCVCGCVYIYTPLYIVVHLSVCIHIYIYRLILIDIYIYTYIHTCLFICMCVRYVYIYVYIGTYVYIHMYVCMYACMHACWMHACMQAGRQAGMYVNVPVRPLAAASSHSNSPFCQILGIPKLQGNAYFHQNSGGPQPQKPTIPLNPEPHTPSPELGPCTSRLPQTKPTLNPKQ